jgi:hypothetical protein
MNKTFDLAVRFVVGGGGIFDKSYTPHKKELAAAAQLGKKFGHDVVLGCVQAMADGEFDDWTRYCEKKGAPLHPSTLWAVQWGHPPYIERYLKGEGIPDIPEVYAKTTYLEWIRKYGKRALAIGKWNGVIMAEISHEEAVEIVGEALATASEVFRRPSQPTAPISPKLDYRLDADICAFSTFEEKP